MMILSTTSPKELSTLYDSNEFNAQFAYKGTLGVNYSKTQTSEVADLYAQSLGWKTARTLHFAAMPVIKMKLSRFKV